MKTTKLDDFTYDQLRLTAKTLIWKQNDIKDHIAEIKKTPSLERMFEKEILEWESQIEDLNMLIIQFTHAAAQKDFERQVASN